MTRTGILMIEDWEKPEIHDIEFNAVMRCACECGANCGAGAGAGEKEK
jgi:hypothetical protein